MARLLSEGCGMCWGPISEACYCKWSRGASLYILASSSFESRPRIGFY